MAVSKKRKGASNKPRRKVMNPMAAPRSTVWRTHLNGGRLPFLKKDPDFLAIVKMGRVVNAIYYAIQSMGDQIGKDSPTSVRQAKRAFWVLGGYLHQGLLLTKSIQGRYLGDSVYEGLRLLVHDREYQKARNYVKAIRNLTAFHLDEYDDTTRETLNKMELAWYPLMSADRLNPMDVYFEFTDIVDMGHLVFKFADGRDLKETADDINSTVFQFAADFAIAANLFLQHLMRKSKIGEFTKTAYDFEKPPKPPMPSFSEITRASAQNMAEEAKEQLAGGEDLLHTSSEGVGEA